MNFLSTLLAVGFALQGPGLLGEVPAKYRPAAPAGDAVIARVDGVAVKASDLAPFLWDWRAEEALTDLLSYQMAKADADAKGVKVSVEEIEVEIGRQLEQMRASLQPGQDLETTLRQEGFTRSRMYLRIASQKLIEKLALRQFDPKEYVKVSTIVVKQVDEQSASVLAALKAAEAAFGRLTAGESWDSVLASVKDPLGRPSGGLLGWRAAGAFPDSVKAQFEKGPTGVVTSPVQTVNGIQIFRLERHGKNAVEAEIAELHEVFLASARQAYATSLRERTKIERLLPGSGGA